MSESLRLLLIDDDSELRGLMTEFFGSNGIEVDTATDGAQGLARTSQADRVAGLEGGADDYLPKPFGPEELLARVRAVLRRASRDLPVVEEEAVESNGVRLLPRTREAFYHEAPVRLTSLEFDILDLLVRSAGRIVSRDEIAAAIHQRDASPLDRSLDVHISHVRKKLEPGRDLILTIRGLGYLFRAGDHDKI